MLISFSFWLDASGDSAKVLDQLLSKEVNDVSAQPQSVEDLKKALEEQGKVIEEQSKRLEDHQKEIETLRREKQEQDKVIQAQKRDIEELKEALLLASKKWPATHGTQFNVPRNQTQLNVTVTGITHWKS